MPLPVSKFSLHSTLNPRLWRQNKLRVEVRLKLLKTGLAFYRFLDLPRLLIADMVLTGSNAAYNYTPLSDLDLHLLVDFGKTPCPDLAANFFTTKKALWNRSHTITIYGQPVELYVEDTTESVTANGIYSILRHHWLKQPTHDTPEPDDGAVLYKAQALADEIDAMLAKPTAPEVETMLQRLRTLRQSGLFSAGEFSVENLAFKVLRSTGYLAKLYDAQGSLRDRSLSIVKTS